MKNLQIYTYAIKENYKLHILGINQRLPYQHSKYATSQPHIQQQSINKENLRPLSSTNARQLSIGSHINISNYIAVAY